MGGLRVAVRQWTVQNYVMYTSCKMQHVVLNSKDIPGSAHVNKWDKFRGSKSREHFVLGPLLSSG